MEVRASIANLPASTSLTLIRKMEVFVNVCEVENGNLNLGGVCGGGNGESPLHTLMLRPKARMQLEASE